MGETGLVVGHHQGRWKMCSKSVLLVLVVVLAVFLLFLYCLFVYCIAFAVLFVLLVRLYACLLLLYYCCFDWCIDSVCCLLLFRARVFLASDVDSRSLITSFSFYLYSLYNVSYVLCLCIL